MGKERNKGKEKNELTKEDKEMNATIEKSRPCTIEESIIKSCKEISLMRKGELPKKDWREAFKELDKKAEDEDGE